MARARGNLNRYADGILKILKDHATTYPELWFRVPALFEREISPAALSNPEPVLIVSLAGEGSPLDLRPLGYQTTRHTMTIIVWIRGKGVDEAAGEMLADLWRVLAQNRQLALSAGSSVGVDDPSGLTLSQGYLSIGNHRLDINDNPAAPEAVIQQEVTVQWTWVGTTP